ncbi:MAG: ABC transporter ATP-binding protein [Deltaproteobacteria bacterium]|nr:ABC transporter ATP-binding protein [Deltaproteobacteria bacterium]
MRANRLALKFSLKKHLHDFHLDIGLELNNEIAVLFGPSGSGKSITLNMLSGIVKPDAGCININERNIFDSTRGIDIPIRKRRIGYLFQDYALFPHMTVFENIAYGISHMPHHEIKDKVYELLELMRLTGIENRHPSQISGGQKQRTALARTLATEPEILLLDEPFSALDNQVREKLRHELIVIHKRFPITTLLVTHDMEEAFMLGERIAVINNGRIEQFGTREDVFYRPMTKNVARFIGARNIFHGVIKSLDNSNIIIDSIETGSIMIARQLIPPYKQISLIKNTDFNIGDKVCFGIRPEEIMIIKTDRPLDRSVQDNLIEGTVSGIMAKGTGYILYFTAKGSPNVNLKIDIPSIVFRRLNIELNKEITVCLKKECIWMIKEG